MKKVYAVKISADAENDIDEIYLWYELQQIGLGELFVEYLNKAVQHVVKYPNSYRQAYKNVHRVLTKKFPYAVYYLVNEIKLHIEALAIVHAKRNPRLIKKRIKK